MHFFTINGPHYEISNNVVCAISTKGLDQPVHMRSLIRAFVCRLKTIGRLAFEVSKLIRSLFVPKCTMSMCGSRGGIGDPDPPGKSQVIWVSIEISNWTPLPPNSWSPSGISVIKPLDPLCKL